MNSDGWFKKIEGKFQSVPFGLAVDIASRLRSCYWSGSANTNVIIGLFKLFLNTDYIRNTFLAGGINKDMSNPQSLHLRD